MSFVSEAELLDAHVFSYSKREGTPAATYEGQIPEEVKKERSAELISRVKEVRDIVLDKVVKEGKALSCILETFDGTLWHSHSDSYIEVVCKGGKSLAGELVSVKPISHKNGIVFGEIVN